MDYISILNVLGWMIGLEGVFFLLPMLVALCYGEGQWTLFLVLALCCLAVGAVLTRLKSTKNHFYVREGNVTVALAWIVMSLIGALPFTISGEIPFYIDALFEIVSGFTTTGASILSDVEALSRGMMFWRCFSHWVGGMGVLVFAMTVMPMSNGGSSFAMMQAESTGPSVSKLVPRLRDTARQLYGIYLGLTVVDLVFLLFGGMSLYDSLCLTFGTVGTGGFGLLNDSCASYTTYVQVVLTVFMILSGVNFQFYFLLLVRRFTDAVHMEEVRWYLLLFGGVTVLITVNLAASQGMGFFTALQQSAFQAASVMTTTGFSSCNYDLWPTFSKALLVLLMLTGACAGSTAGGIKVCRVLIYGKLAVRDARAVIRPRQVRAIRLDGKPLEDRVIRGSLMFLLCYLILFVVSVLVVSLDSADFTTAFTAVLATFNNIGPGLADVGPAANFGFYSPLSKLVLIFDMLAGRLEIIPMLLLCFPSTWRR